MVEGHRVTIAPIDWKRTVHCLGDLHAGAITAERLEAVAADVERLGTPALHLQVGDATERGLPSEDEEALGFLGRLPGGWITALGNHDVLGNKRSVAAWARAYGQEGQNLCVDLEFARVIVVGPNRTEPGKRAGRLSLDTLDFLDERLGEAKGRDCWIACHWPLFKTVMGDPNKHFTSAMAAFYAKPPDRIRELLRRHRNAKAWISGHTHSPISAPGLIRRKPLGPKRSIVTINGSGLVGVGKTRDPADPLCSLYLTHRDDLIEVRCRDHRAGEWRNIQGRRVVEVRTGG